LYAFGPFRVDADRGLLLRGDEPVPLTAKCLETLLVLLQHREETVSKDVLMKTVWPDTFVEESNLTQHISMLRKALGESPQDRLYVVTVPGQGYRFVADVREVAREADATIPKESDDSAFVHTRKRTWLAIAAVAVVLVGIAGTLWLRHTSAQSALSEKDSILLADFENSTHEEVFDGALKEGTAVELGQSPYLDLISNDRVRDTLRHMGRSPDEPVRLPLAREVCERVGAKVLITGSIAQVGTSYVLALDAVDCTDSDVLVREQVEARNREEVLPVLGKATSKLRGRLGESLNSIRRFDVPIVEATTPSLEALKAYSLGIDARTRATEKNAIPLFEHAIELDPKFAMAYAQLGGVYNNLGETGRASDYIKKAYALQANLSEREKLFLTVRYHTVVTGDLEKATETHEIWSRMYPRDPAPFNGLAARYQVVGEYEKAAAAARQALRLRPDHYVPYANLATSYLALGRLDDARAVCQQAATAGRESIYTHRVLFDLAYLKNDAAAMQHELDWATGTERENDMLAIQAGALIGAGKVRAARSVFEKSWAASERNGLLDDAAYSMAGEALAEADFGNQREARTRAMASLKLGRGIDAEETVAETLALSGDLVQPKALVDDLRERFPHHAPLINASLPTILATAEMQHNSPAKAIQTLQQAAPYDLSEFTSLSSIYIRGLAYLRSGSGKEAATEFQKIVDHPGIDVTSERHALARLGLARAYAIMGDREKSRKEYEDFFVLWASADSDLPALRQAKVEYEKLR
jgi:eukaryotic-like serine/threonine-protein kinase